MEIVHEQVDESSWLNSNDWFLYVYLDKSSEWKKSPWLDENGRLAEQNNDTIALIAFS